MVKLNRKQKEGSLGSGGISGGTLEIPSIMAENITKPSQATSQDREITNRNTQIKKIPSEMEVAPRYNC